MFVYLYTTTIKVFSEFGSNFESSSILPLKFLFESNPLKKKKTFNIYKFQLGWACNCRVIIKVNNFIIKPIKKKRQNKDSNLLLQVTELEGAEGKDQVVFLNSGEVKRDLMGSLAGLSPLIHVAKQ